MGKQRLFTKDQDRIIEILAERGFTGPEVAERLKRDEFTLRGRARKIGVRFRPNGSRGWVGYLTSEVSP